MAVHRPGPLYRCDEPDGCYELEALDELDALEELEVLDDELVLAGLAVLAGVLEVEPSEDLVAVAAEVLDEPEPVAFFLSLESLR